MFKAARPNTTTDDARFFIKPKLYDTLPPRQKAYVKLFGDDNIFQLINKIQTLKDDIESQPTNTCTNDELTTIANKSKYVRNKTLPWISQAKKYCEKCGGKGHTTDACEGKAICKRCGKIEVK